MLYLLLSARHRPLLHRFKAGRQRSGNAPLWIHACSVGEVGVARELVAAWKKECPDVPVVLSVSTLSGLRLAHNNIPGITAMLAPFDVSYCVRGFLKRVKPCLLVLVETEVWPNMVRETRKKGISVVVVNGRLSPKKFPTYWRYRRLLPPVFSYLSHVGAQTQEYADKFAALGVQSGHISVTGNIKYNAVITDVSSEKRAAVRHQNGFSKKDRLILFGSTRPGDEAFAAQCWQALKGNYPDLRLIIAPRHMQRLEEALKPFEGEPVLRRSEVLKGRKDWHARVFFLDTLGELTDFYAASTLAVVGGSFFPGVEGHNPLEPAALGIPTLFGKYMGNFPDASAMLLAAGGAIQVNHPEELSDALKHLLDHPSDCDRISARGRKAILNNQGVVQRHVELLTEYLH